MTTLIWLIPLPPLLAFFLIILFTNRHNGLSHNVAVGAAWYTRVAPEAATPKDQSLRGPASP